MTLPPPSMYAAPSQIARCRDAVARSICDYFDELPEQATWIQRKSASREYSDKAEVRDDADAAIRAFLTVWRDLPLEDGLAATAEIEPAICSGFTTNEGQLVSPSLGRTLAVNAMIDRTMRLHRSIIDRFLKQRS